MQDKSTLFQSVIKDAKTLCYSKEEMLRQNTQQIVCENSTGGPEARHRTLDMQYLHAENSMIFRYFNNNGLAMKMIKMCDEMMREKIDLAPKWRRECAKTARTTDNIIRTCQSSPFQIDD